MINANSVYLGDCYELIKYIPDKSIDLVYTDIPYLMDSGGKGAGAFGDRVHRLIRKDMEHIINGIDYSIYDQYVRVLKKINIFIWCSKNQMLDTLNYFSKFGTFDILVWCKTNPTPMCNNNWLPDIEYCLYFREKGVTLNDGYKLKSKWYVSSINKKDKDIYDHPTIKPLDLVKRHILETTNEGGGYPRHVYGKWYYL